MRENLRRARRVAMTAALVTLSLAVGKWLVGRFVNSTALQADGVDSATDTLALAASWVGLYIASREASEQFPWGFFRAESLGALVVSGFIIVLGGRYMWEGIRHFGRVPQLQYSAAGLAAAVISIAAAYGLYRWQQRTSAETGSQSLGATADEMKVDMGKSAGVFVALLCSQFRVPYVESLVTLIIAGLILRAGFRNLKTAVLSLMDASADPELEREVAQIIEGVPGVRGVEKIHARRSGPFYFVEGHVDMSPDMHVVRSHALAHRAADAVKEQKPRVEGVVLHVEPYRGEVQNVLVPVDEDSGLEAPVCEHFGRAPFFVLATLTDEEVTERRVLANQYADRDVRAGLAVIREIVQDNDVDAVLVRQIGEIAYHGLHDAGSDVYAAPAGTARQALRAFADRGLNVLSEPTHPSDEPVE